MESLTVRADSSCLPEHYSGRMRKTMPVICGIALVLCLFLQSLFAQVSTPTPAPTRTKTLVFLGDSLTAGLGLQSSEGFPGLMAEKVRVAGLTFVFQNGVLRVCRRAGAW